MITKTEINRSNVECKKGWAFSVYFNNLVYANLVSALYKTKRLCQQKLEVYIKTGVYDWYGDAE